MRLSKIRSFEEIEKEIKEEVDKYPNNWKIIFGRSPDGMFFDYYFFHNAEMWQIKVETIFKHDAKMAAAYIGDVDKEKMESLYSRCDFVSSESLEGESAGDMSDDEDGVFSEIKAYSELFKYKKVAGQPPSFEPLEIMSLKHKLVNRRLRKHLEKLIKSSGDIAYE